MSDIKVKKDIDARVFDMSIDIDASADAVWSALTEARELTRWFPLEARVIPGEGGSMYWGWGEGELLRGGCEEAEGVRAGSAGVLRPHVRP